MAATEGQESASAVAIDARRVSIGALEALILDGALRQLRIRGVEVLRGIDCPIRDVNWGTATPEAVEAELVVAEDHALFKRRFQVFGGALSADLRYRFTGNSVSAALTLQAHRRVETNRAGFTLLHPIDGVAGAAMIVTHSDGTEETTVFPDRISPSQPAFDIAAIRHDVGPVSVDIRFSDEVFEMEDQRNWTDASYKTYCRPLGLGFPYVIEAGETVVQAIDITLAAAELGEAASTVTRTAAQALPQVALAIDPAWMANSARETLLALPGAVRLVRIDAARPDELGRLDAVTGPVDLEVVIDDSGDGAAALQALAQKLSGNGISVARVIALPRAYLNSYQPDADWPSGHSVADAAEWAQTAFPEADIGVGMLTNFTELNRHPPPEQTGEFVTYSTTAIVHAGDDLSVFETLEALPHVHASAGVIAGGRPLRLGLATIGMRSNPYGAGVADNPGRARIAMAMEDPRQDTVFAAAFAVGAYAAAVQSGCARVALAGAGGPFATGRMIDGAFHAYPIHHVLTVLSDMCGTADAEGLPRGLRGVLARSGRFRGILANCSVQAVCLEMPGQRGIVMDHGLDVGASDWLETAAPRALDSVELSPAAVVFLCDGEGG